MSTGEPAETFAQSQGQTGTFCVKGGLAQMLKGGIIMDVVNEKQARIAEEAGACAVMALEKVPADIRKDGGVARMVDPKVSRYSLVNPLPIDTRKGSDKTVEVVASAMNAIVGKARRNDHWH